MSVIVFSFKILTFILNLLIFPVVGLQETPSGNSIIWSRFHGRGKYDAYFCLAIKIKKESKKVLCMDFVNCLVSE